MTAASTPPPSSASPSMSLRPMRWWDIEAVLELETELFAEDAWSPALFWSELAEHDNRHYLVMLEGDRIIGYGGVAVYRDEAYVQTVGITPTEWGRGLGSALLTALLAEAEKRDVHTVVLEVRADNERAQRLYQRFGFSTVGVRRGYYQPSGEDAHVMMRRVS